MLDTARLASGDVDAALAASHVRVRGRLTTPLDVPGLHRAPVRDRLARDRGRARDPQLDPGSIRHAGLARQAVRTSGRANPDPQRAAGRSVRRQDDDHRPAGGLGGAGAGPPGCAGDDPQRGHGGEQPGGRGDSVARARRRRRGQPHRDPLARAGRPRRYRRLRGRVDRLAVGLGPLPLAGPRADLARRGHQPGDVRRLPGPHGPAGRVRGRVADRRARPPSGDGSARATAAQRRRRGRSQPGRTGVPDLRRAPVPRAAARPPAVGPARRSLRRRGHRRRDRMVARRLRARGGGLPPGRRRQPDRDHRRRRHERGRDRFATIAAEAFGVDPSKIRVVNADTSSAPYAGTSGGSKVTYTVGRAVERAATEARERLLEVAADELEIAPEDLEIVNGSVQPVGRAREGDRDPGARRRRSSASAAPTRRSRATAASRCRRPRSRPLTSRTSASTRTPARYRARPRGRPGRRPRAEPGAGRGPDAGRHHPGTRLGAVRGARPRQPRPAHHRHVRRLRDADGVDRPLDRHRDRRGPGPRGALWRQGRGRGSGRRRGRRGGQRDRRRDRRRQGLAAADDARARLAGDERNGDRPSV